MTRRDHVVVEERVVDESGDDGRGFDDRYHRRSRGGIGRALLVLLLIGAVAVIAFFAFGGTADVDTEGDLDVPEVDVDVNPPDVEVDSNEAPPASADASETG